MSEVVALTVCLIQVKNNFIHLHSKILNKFKNALNPVGYVTVKHGQNNTSYGSCHSNFLNVNGENAFNISATHAKTLGLSEGDTVIISPAVQVKPLKTVQVTPVCTDDWDILEASAETVQLTLLNQIRVVCVHQVLTIWLSKSFSVRIHVDRLGDDVHYGSLELHTEVIVSPNIKRCEICTPSEDSLTSPHSSEWKFPFFKDILGFVGARKQESSEKDVSVPSKFTSLGVFRYVPATVLSLGDDSLISSYQYNVFISKKFVRKDWTTVPRCKYMFCRLTSLPYSFPKSSKEEKSKSDSKSSVGVRFSGREMYARLFVLEDVSTFSEGNNFAAVNSYQTVFVPEAVRQFLGTRINCKIKVDLVCRNESNTSLALKYDDSNEESVYEADRSHLEILNSGIESSKSADDDNEEDMETDGCDFFHFEFLDKLIKNVKTILLLEAGLLKSRNGVFSIENTNHMVIEGDTGSGKSTILNILYRDLLRCDYGIFVKRIECKALKGKLVPKLKKLLKKSLDECVHFQPAVLFLDDLDILFTTSKQNENQSEQSVSTYTRRVANMIRDLLVSYSEHYVSVLATVVNASSLESCLFQARGHAIFSISIRLPSLNRDMRKDVLLRFLNEKDIRDEVLTGEYLQDVIQQMEGYCIQDVADLVDLVYFEILKKQVKSSLKKDSLVLHKEDVNTAISQIVPVSLKDIDFHKNTTIKWKNVGGLELAKQCLMEILIWPSKYPNVFNQCPLKMQSGILLYGAPGCGKTLLASAVAGESGLNFISIKGPELLSKFVGESEEGVRNTFKKAQNAKPCILFFDEFDSLAPRRGNDITGVTDRVVNQLLTELDGVESVSGVWVLAATSRPDLIDPALLRPGRLGTLVHCTLPDERDRLSILEVVSVSSKFADNVDLKLVAKNTEGYTGADLQAVLYNAHMKSNKIDVQTQLPTEGINMECFLAAIEETKSSLKPAERLAYENIYKKFSQKEENIRMELDKQRITYA